MTHICVSKLTIIGSDNGLLPGKHQAIIWTNARILLIGPLGANFNKILIEIHTFSLKKIHLKMSGKWWPFCLGLNVLTTHWGLSKMAIIWQTFSNPHSQPPHKQLGLFSTHTGIHIINDLYMIKTRWFQDHNRNSYRVLVKQHLYLEMGPLVLPFLWKQTQEAFWPMESPLPFESQAAIG